MKIFFDMVGCRLNQAEIEQMARQFRIYGHTIVASAKEADTVVVNTCSVTAEAASDSRQKIRKAARVGVNNIYVTGCWSTLQPEQASELSHVMKVIPNDQKDTLVDQILGIETEQNSISDPETIGTLSQSHVFELEPISRIPIPGLRQRTRAFIKVQDGCNNACTFCITTLARGEAHSTPTRKILQNIQAALNGGVKEIILTGVHLGSWGQDFGLHLHDLIKLILKETDTPRLRLSSIEPWDLNEDFFSLWEDKRLCPHIHLPLQAGSSSTLKRMLRKTTPTSFKELTQFARKIIPNIAITTDLIAGFPGETDSEFEETLSLVKLLNFAGGHVFSYSARPGTPAARIKDQIPLPIRKERNHQLQSVLADSSLKYRTTFIGQVLPVLWEASAIRNELGWQIEGLTGNYIRVKANSPELRWNQIDMVKLFEPTGDGIYGEIV